MNSRGMRCRKRVAGGVAALVLGAGGLIAVAAVPAQAEACQGVSISGASGTVCVTPPGGVVNALGMTIFENLSSDTATVTCGFNSAVLPPDPNVFYSSDFVGKCSVSFSPY
jgi:hypothetical protein